MKQKCKGNPDPQTIRISVPNSSQHAENSSQPITTRDPIDETSDIDELYDVMKTTLTGEKASGVSDLKFPKREGQKSGIIEEITEETLGDVFIKPKFDIVHR